MNAPHKPPRASADSVEIVTLGCRLNAFESEAMRALARDAALHNAVIVNTCAVTSEAVRQARQTIRRARRERPDAKIIVTGCAAQIDPQGFAAMPEVDRVVGNAEKMHANTFRSEERVQVADIMSVREIANHLVDGFAERTRAYVQVQNGCDHRCTFCIIPYGRGNSRSAPAGDVVDQVRRLVDNGTPEVVLTGVDLTSWGGDLPGAPTLGNLVARILKHAPDLKMLRLSSIDAIEIDDQLFDLVTQNERVAPHLHLSLQHGDDLILKRMKRRHSRAQAIDLCQRLKRARPEIALGADLIAGFPTETEGHFVNTLALIEECGVAFVHAFPFSPRTGTPAARMPQVERGIVKARAARLREASGAVLSKHLDAWVGREADALVERDGFARLPDFTSVRYGQLASRRHAPAPAGEHVGGPYLHLRFTHHDGAHLIGTPA
jgi:threonylcarbamoyladenosine tRNA methylthiotransferase MtaB